jgi:hypothetical protein
MPARAPFSPFRTLLVSGLLAQGWIAGAATIAATQTPPNAKSSPKEPIAGRCKLRPASTNAAIVSAGSSGAVSIFVSDDADGIVDVNGYFPPGGGRIVALDCHTLSRSRHPKQFRGLRRIAHCGRAGEHLRSTSHGPGLYSECHSCASRRVELPYALG